MNQLLPTKNLDNSLDNYSNNSTISCFLKVDIDYSDKLRDSHNCYPLASEKIKVTD